MRDRAGRPPARRASALTLPRAAAQRGLLAAVLGIIVAGTTVLGTGTLLLTVAQDQVLAGEFREAAPERVDVTAVVRGQFEEDPIPDPDRVHGTTTARLEAALRPFGAETSSWLSSTPLLLPSGTEARRYAYLGDTDTLTEHSHLVTGRWPRPGESGEPVEVAVLSSTAAALGLTEGSSLVLGPRTRDAADGGPTEVVVVGVITPAPGGEGAWDRDLLRGAGLDRSPLRVPTYGPFVVAPGTLLSIGPGITRLDVVSVPDLSAALPGELAAVGAALRTAREDLSAALGDAPLRVLVRSPFPDALAVAQAQQGVTRSGTTALTLLGVAVAGAALGLAGRLVVTRRAAERTLLSARGAARGHLVGHAALEAGALAALGTALAVPLALGLYALLAALPPLARAGLAPTGVTPALLATVATGSVALAAVLVVPALRPPGGSAGRARGFGAVLARSGADLALAAVAVVGYLQLRTHPFGGGPGIDPILVGAPVLCLLAGAVLVLRVLPPVAHLAEGFARRSRSLTVPLAAWELARRPHATSGAFLLVLATAAATFGLAFGQTWSDSQQDQADAAVGTDLAVDVTGAPPLAQGGALAALTGARPAPVTNRGVGLGSRASGTATGPTRLVALDTTRADDLLRGRLPAPQRWSDLTEGLAPDLPAGGVRIPPGDLTLEVTGAGADGTPLLVSPTLVLQDPWGDRVAVTAPDVPLDGDRHRVGVRPDGAGGRPVEPELRLVAIHLRVNLGAGAQVSPEYERATDVTVAVRIVEGTAAGTGGWHAARPPAADGTVSRAAAEEVAGSEGVTVTASATVTLTALLYGPGDLVVTAFDTPTALPIVVSTDLAESLALEPGDTLSLSLETASVRAVVVRTVPYVPSAARGPAVLADHDALTRAVIGQGQLTSMTDTWWVGNGSAAPAAAAAVTAGNLGDPVNRLDLAGDLREGPLRAPLRAAGWLLVAASLALALAGAAVHTAAAIEMRAVDVARLQGQGVPRRTVVGSFLIQHAVVSVLAVATGAGAGALVAALVGPRLVVSAAGLPPVPGALFAWPWPAQGALLAGLLLAGGAVAAPVAVRVVRRATVAHLRLDAP